LSLSITVGEPSTSVLRPPIDTVLSTFQMVEVIESRIGSGLNTLQEQKKAIDSSESDASKLFIGRVSPNHCRIHVRFRRRDSILRDVCQIEYWRQGQGLFAGNLWTAAGGFRIITI
jgi:hypothetical protein